MPLYEYQCDECGHTFEKIQKFSDPLEDACPKCGGPVRKLMSSPAIQFKGSGWYITDYAKKSAEPVKSDGTSDTKTASADKSASSGSKAETPAAKPDTSAPAAKESKTT
ncbi:MAG TPA: zinc ribbon domain-containing protein [Vicinamibacterales bacterium]|nr:zinc ribbon domain-containing protein [Vicinamibacterales bacterium]